MKQICIKNLFFTNNIGYYFLTALTAICIIFYGCGNGQSAQNKNKQGLLSSDAQGFKNVADTSSNEMAATDKSFAETDYDPQDVVTASLTGAVRDLPLYGFNGNNIRGPSWESKAYRDSIAALKLQIIRYPGGSVGEWWDWRKGWFVDEKKANGNLKLPDGFKNINPVADGLNELKILSDEAGCDVLFTLNMVTSTLGDQLAMLKQAQAIGIPVKWIELGNELNLPKSPGRQEFGNAKEYAQTCAQWIKAIKDNFPGVKIAAVGGNQNYSNDVKSWNTTLSSTAQNPDAIVAHLYPLPPKVVDNTGINFKKLYNEFQSRFNAQGFNKVTNKSIWVTEYNIHWAYGPEMSKAEKEQLQRNSATWGQSLASVLMTSEATSLSPNVQMVINHNLSGIRIWAAIETQNQTFKKLANGIGMAAWLGACYKMSSIQKLSFSNTGNQTVNDYELVGWKFAAGKSDYALLLVNFTNNSYTINVKNLNLPNNIKVVTEYAGKNAVLNSSADVKKQQGIVKDNTVNLPAYSITTIQNQNH